MLATHPSLAEGRAVLFRGAPRPRAAALIYCCEEREREEDTVQRKIIRSEKNQRADFKEGDKSII